MSEEKENVSLSASAVCPDEGRFPTLAELQVGLGSGGKIREFLENKKNSSPLSSSRKLSTSYLRDSGVDPQCCHVLHAFGKVSQKDSSFSGLEMQK